ncbi:cryptochrome/photolyase family protein [Sinomicrobium oceani]|uniref:cryptochrome/photolyase family protein n=1 Tax=Sinomicrobium oceani TaxID=1150368 RepID=UPI0038B4F00C
MFLSLWRREPCFFIHDSFHKQKILYHQASMKCYADYLCEHGFEARYVDTKCSNRRSGYYRDRSPINITIKKCETVFSCTGGLTFFYPDRPKSWNSQYFRRVRR